MPTTSGDYAAAPGMPRFKVTREEENGQPVVEEYATYREARIAQSERGGKLRTIRD